MVAFHDNFLTISSLNHIKPKISQVKQQFPWFIPHLMPHIKPKQITV